MTRRSDTIAKMFQKDKNMVLALSDIGVLTPQMAKEFYNIGQHRLDQLTKSNYITQPIKDVEGQDRALIYLTDAGKRYVLNEFNKPDHKFPVVNSQQLDHDLRMSLLYCLMGPSNWRTESMVRDDMRAEMGLAQDYKIQGIDATTQMLREDYLKFMEEHQDHLTFINFSQTLAPILNVGVEIIGTSYNDATCQSRIDAGASHCDVMIIAEK